MKKYNLNLEFEIISSFNPKDRLNKLDEIPETLDGYTDYWQAAKLLCEKDGGRLPTVEELLLIVVLQKNKLIDTSYSGNFWSSTPSTSNGKYAYFVSFSVCDWFINYRDTTNYQALCLRDFKITSK